MVAEIFVELGELVAEVADGELGMGQGKVPALLVFEGLAEHHEGGSGLVLVVQLEGEAPEGLGGGGVEGHGAAKELDGSGESVE